MQLLNSVEVEHTISKYICPGIDPLLPFLTLRHSYGKSAIASEGNGPRTE